MERAHDELELGRVPSVEENIEAFGQEDIRGPGEEGGQQLIWIGRFEDARFPYSVRGTSHYGPGLFPVEIIFNV